MTLLCTTLCIAWAGALAMRASAYQGVEAVAALLWLAPAALVILAVWQAGIRWVPAELLEQGPAGWRRAARLVTALSVVTAVAAWQRMAQLAAAVEKWLPIPGAQPPWTPQAAHAAALRAGVLALAGPVALTGLVWLAERKWRQAAEPPRPAGDRAAGGEVAS